VVGVAQLVERRTVAPNVVGSNPISHPRDPPVGFERQLDIFMAIVAALLVFVGCIFMIGISIKISLIISICVMLGGLIFGRRVAEIVGSILS
jgi:hypothetical protein